MHLRKRDRWARERAVWRAKQAAILLALTSGLCLPLVLAALGG